MKKSVQKVLEVAGWTLAMLFIPIVSLIFWIFRMQSLKKKNPEMKRGYMWWAFGIASTAWFIFLLPVALFMALLITDPEGFSSSFNKTEELSQYGCAEGLYKLTGVEFPEVAMIDAHMYVDAGIPSRYWYEHKFAIKPSDMQSLHSRLEQACVSDSTHWEILDGPSYQRTEVSWLMGRNADDEYAANPAKVYWYLIYPDSTSVDRSLGMCDRVNDIDGSFVSVEVQNDTIWIREGWLR